MPWAKRILFKTALTPFTGYGNDGIGLAIALSQAGYDVTLSPTLVQPPLPAPVAALLTRPIEPPYDMLLHHIDPVQLGLSQGERRAADTKVAWTMWEFSSLGPEFDAPIGPPGDQRTIEERLDDYDLILAYDEVSRGALEPRTKTPIKKLQGGYFADSWSHPPDNVHRDWNNGPFRFCMVGALHDRKNPWVTLSAFRALRERRPELDVELHLKTVTQTLHPKIEEAYPGVKIHYETWTHQKMLEFYHQMHCLVAPSWGEGKNLPALEAMTTGIPVIATEIGGHAEWMSSVDAIPVAFTLADHVPGMFSARADVKDLTDKMEYAVDERGRYTKQRGEVAAKTIPAMCDWSKVVARLGDITA